MPKGNSRSTSRAKDNNGVEATPGAGTDDDPSALLGINRRLDDLFTQLANTDDRIKTVVQTAIAAEFDRLNDRLEEREQVHQKEVSDLITMSKTQRDLIQNLDDRIASLEKGKRNRNLVITGLAESATEHVKTQVNNLLSILGVGFNTDHVEACYRMGQRNKLGTRPSTGVTEVGATGGEVVEHDRQVAGHTPGARDTQTQRQQQQCTTPATNARPPPIMLILLNIRQKGLIYKNIHKLKGKHEWASTHINDDLPADELRKQRDLRALAAHCRTHGKSASQVGMSLKYEGQRYSMDQLEDLPKGFMMSCIKIREAQDGVAFQSEYAYISSMFPIPIKYEGTIYKSAEALYQSRHAAVCNRPDLAQQIIQAPDAFAAKALSRKIPLSNKWELNKVEVMTEVVQLKFDQNDQLRAELLKTKGYLYECTYDKFWACGYSLAQVALISQAALTKVNATNKLGEILREYRDRMKISN